MKSTVGPVLVFLPKKDNGDAYIALSKFVAEHLAVPQYYINTPDAAIREMLVAKNINRGIFFLTPKFARGFDIKMASESFGIVFDVGHRFHSSTVLQMIGRTDRA